MIPYSNKPEYKKFSVNDVNSNRRKTKLFRDTVRNANRSRKKAIRFLLKQIDNEKVVSEDILNIINDCNFIQQNWVTAPNCTKMVNWSSYSDDYTIGEYIEDQINIRYIEDVFIKLLMLNKNKYNIGYSDSYGLIWYHDGIFLSEK